MTTDFRVLCAELTDKLHEYAIANPVHDTDQLVTRARAALATALEGGPSDEELYALWDKQGLEGDFQDCRRFYRIAAARYGTPAPVPVAERLPEPGKKVIAHYRNDLGKWRTVVAEYVPAKYRDGETMDGDYTEYDEETDKFYWPEGWYEQIENWEEYSAITIDEGVVTHWQPLPSPPEAQP